MYHAPLLPHRNTCTTYSFYHTGSHLQRNTSRFCVMPSLSAKTTVNNEGTSNYHTHTHMEHHACHTSTNKQHTSSLWKDNNKNATAKPTTADTHRPTHSNTHATPVQQHHLYPCWIAAHITLLTHYLPTTLDSTNNNGCWQLLIIVFSWSPLSHDTSAAVPAVGVPYRVLQQCCAQHSLNDHFPISHGINCKPLFSSTGAPT